MSDSAGSLPPEMAKEQKIRMLHKFYQTSTLEELVLAQDHQIEKLQGKPRERVIYSFTHPYLNKVREG